MKLKVTILFILVLSLSNQGRCVSHFYRTSEGNSSDVRGCVTSVFQSQLGTREATGQNDGTAVEMYLQSVGLGKGYAWCGAFVHWALRECLSPDQIRAFLPRPSAYAWTPNFVANEHYLTTTPQPGDLITLYYASKKRVGHVGFVENYTSGSKVITVEGNTNEAGSREGDGVYRKYRLKSQIYRYVDVIQLAE